MKVTRYILTAVVAAICQSASFAAVFPDDAFTDAARGTTSAGFLKAPPSARLAGLAGAGLAAYGPDAFFLNAAGLLSAAPGSASFAAAYELLPGETTRTGLCYSRAAAGGVIGAGLIYQDASAGMEQLDGAGLSAGGAIPAYDAAVSAVWARRYKLADISLGAKYIRTVLAGETGVTAALDAGAIFRAGPGSATDFALSVRNFGPALKTGSESAPLPFEAGAGLRWRHSGTADFFLEGRLPADHDPYLVLAGEWRAAADSLFLRLGMNFKNYDDLGFMGAFAGGFGVKLNALRLDYAFTPFGELGVAHKLTAALTWGGAPGPGATKLAGGGPQDTLLVAPFEQGLGVKETEAETVRGMVESELGRAGRFRLLDRSAANLVVKERELLRRGVSASSVASELGRLSGAAVAVYGSVYKNSSGYLVTVNALEPSTGELLRSESATVAETHFFPEAARRVSAALSAP